MFIFLGLRLSLLYADDRFNFHNAIDDFNNCSFLCSVIGNGIQTVIFSKKWSDILLSFLSDCILGYAVLSLCNVAYRDSQYRRIYVFRLMLISPVLLLSGLLKDTTT